MSREQENKSDKVYYTVFDQKFRTKVREGTPEAIERINKKGVRVFEREVSALFGVVEDIFLEDSDFGKQVKIVLDKNEEGKNPVIGFGVESKNGRDILKILPGVNFAKEVRILPYRFTPEGESEERSGISIAQADEDGKFTVKVQNYFVDPVTKGPANGFPTINWDKATEAEQKIYKIQRDAFLVESLEENILPKFAKVSHAKKDVDFGNPSGQTENGFEYPEEEVKPEDIPF